MHMSDALLSAPVAIAADAVAALLLAVAVSRVKKDGRENIVPLMGVMGAFVFAAQMVNFSIPGTGSSGHIVGGILLAAILGPWAGFLTLSSVIIIQCLVFADGGLMALGCNLLNMGAMTTLVAYPLIFRPLVGSEPSGWRLMSVAVLASVIGLELGACMVTLETMLSGITALPTDKFFMLMSAIHLAIGLGEGIATGAVLIFVNRYRPDLINGINGVSPNRKANGGVKKIVIWFAVAAAVIAGGLAFLASEKPDGLEWSIEKITGTTDIEAEHTGALSSAADHIQHTTAIMPDYDNTLSGIAGALMVLILVWGIATLLVRKKKPVGEKV